MAFKDAPTLADLQRIPRAQPKPVRGERKSRRYPNRGKGDPEFAKVREQVWRLDESRSRASGKKLQRVTSDLSVLGVVAHIKSRGAHPELKYALSNVILLSQEEHIWSDPRTADAGGRALLDIRGTNANGSLTFIRRDVDGRELWRHTSARKAQ